MAWGRSPSLYLFNTKQLLHVRDEKTAGTSGGTFTSGAWRTRTLNTTVTNTISAASLSSNQVTLPAGSYYVQGSAPAMGIELHKARLYNITGSADLLIGTSETTITANPPFVQTRSLINGPITLTASTVIELQHRCSLTRNSDGLGNAVSLDSKAEVYSELMFWKVN